MRSATQTRPHAAEKTQTSSLAAREIVDGGWVEAVDTLLYELNKEHFPEGVCDEDGLPLMDICLTMFPPDEREHLRSVVATVKRMFPFPSFETDKRRHDPDEAVVPTCRELLQDVEKSLAKMSERKFDDRLAAEDRLDAEARFLLLRSGLCRVAAEINAFLLQQMERVKPESEAGFGARSSHRDHLVDALRNDKFTHR